MNKIEKARNRLLAFSFQVSGFIEGMRLRALAHAYKEAFGLINKAAERAEAANNEMAAPTKYNGDIGPKPDDGGN